MIIVIFLIIFTLPRESISSQLLRQNFCYTFPYTTEHQTKECKRLFEFYNIDKPKELKEK